MSLLAKLSTGLCVALIFSATGALWATHGDDVFLNTLLTGLSGCFI